MPPVLNRCYGFIEGADLAASDLNANDINITYTCLGTFLDTYDNELLGENWFNNGIEIIFPATGAGSKSIIRAAETTNKAVFGIDIDQSYLSDTVISSSLKNITIATYDTLKKFYNNDLDFGNAELLNINDNAVGLSMNSSKFKNFKEKDYNLLLYKMKLHHYKIFTFKDYTSINDLPLDNVTLTIR